MHEELGLNQGHHSGCSRTLPEIGFSQLFDSESSWRLTWLVKDPSPISSACLVRGYAAGSPSFDSQLLFVHLFRGGKQCWIAASSQSFSTSPSRIISRIWYHSRRWWFALCEGERSPWSRGWQYWMHPSSSCMQRSAPSLRIDPPQLAHSSYLVMSLISLVQIPCSHLPMGQQV